MRVALLLAVALMECHRHDFREVEVVLSVTTSPPTEVMVIPPAGTTTRGARSLGRTPIQDAQGVFVGDTIRLTNPTQSISYEEAIQYGQPGEHKLISKKFKTKP